MSRRKSSPKPESLAENAYLLTCRGKMFFALVVMPRTRFWGALSRSLAFVARRFRLTVQRTEILLLRQPIPPSCFAPGASLRPRGSSSEETWSSGSDLPN